MSKFTISVEEIVQTIWDEGHENNDDLELPSFSSAFEEDDEKIKYARDYIFNFPFPCYGNEDDKKELEYDILSDYYFREINCDSIARWQRQLRNRLHDIMPKYIEIYNSQMKLIASDIMNPYRIDESRQNKYDAIKDKQIENRIKNDSIVEGESNASTVNHNEGVDNTINGMTHKYSDTPQALVQTGKDYLSNITKEDTDTKNDYSSDISSNDTTSNKSKSKDDTLNKGVESDSETRNEDYVRLVKGNLTKRDNAQLIKAYQDVIMNIEYSIIKELNDLFYLVY